MYLILIFLTFLLEVESLKCLQCVTSHHKGCAGRESAQVCGEEHDMCFSLTHADHVYEMMLNKSIIRKRYRKGCANSIDTCQSLCKWYLQNGYQCRVDCCYGNRCNKEVVVIDRRKRLTNSTSPNIHKKHGFILILSVLLYFQLIS